jgi:hypothetical protein
MPTLKAFRLRDVFMRIIAILLLALFGAVQGAGAAKAPPAVPKPIYAAPMRVVIVRNSSAKCEPTCPTWIDAEGEITTATPQAFRKVFKQMGKTKLPIVIRSPGGSIEAALQIGKMLRERGLTIAVGYTRFTSCSPADPTCKLPAENKGIYTGNIEEDRAFCNSACPMLIAGGTTRLASYLTSVGVHQPKTTWTRQNLRYREFYRIVKGKKKVISRTLIGRINLKDKVTFGLNPRLRKTLATYYSSMGIDLAILDETIKAKFDDMNFLSQAQTDKLHIRTSPQRALYLASPTLCGTTPTSAVCVEDKSRDPKQLAILALKDLGVDPDSPAMSFRLARRQDANCDTSCPVWIAADGIIVPETPAKFRTFLKMQGLPPVLVLINSTGGNPLAAMDLGRSIREAGLETSVARSQFESAAPVAAATKQKQQLAVFKADGHCNGACIFAYAGGKLRHAHADTVAELRNPKLYAGTASSDVSIAMNLYLAEMGVLPALMTKLHTIKTKKSLLLQRSDMLSFGLATDGQNLGDLLSAEKCKARLWAVSCLAPDNQ